MAIYSRYSTIRTLLAIIASLALSSCDNGVKVSTELSPSGQEGSNPTSSLTFAKSQGELAGEERLTQPGARALRSTLASSDTENRSLNDLQILVFGPMCAGCHQGGGLSQPSIMDMTSAKGTYAALVNQMSANDPSSQLVSPGNAGASHLMKVLDGTQERGSRMPMRAAELSDDLKAAVRNWIDSGAKR